MAKKQKLLKNLLTSVSVASIVASIGGSSGAFALNIGAGPNVNLNAVGGFATGGPGDRELNFDQAGVTLTVNIKENIADIITTKAGNIIIAESMAITGTVGGPNSATATINDGITLTLSGKDHEGLDAVTLNGAGSTLVLGHEAILHDTAVITTDADGEGILTFKGNGTVAGSIGEDALALAEINITDPDAVGREVVELGEDVYTKKLYFGTNNEVRIAGNFGGGAKVGGAAGAAGKVDFGAGGALTFNGLPGDLKEFNATIVNGEHGVLYVEGKLKATHADIGNIGTINIGTAAVAGPHAAAAVPGFLTIDASAGNVDLLSDSGGAVQAINFLDVNSELRLLTDGADSTITFHDDLPGGVGGAGDGGIVLLEGANGHTLTLQSKTGAETLGIDVNKLTRLDVRGKVTIAGMDNAAAVLAGGGAVANKLDISNTLELNVINGAVFTDEGATSARIAAVNIGAAEVGGVVGKATYVLDAKYGDFGILNGGKAIHFKHQDAQLTLRNSSAENKTITFHGNLEGVAAGNGGILSLEGTGGLLTLNSDGTAPITFGLANNLTRLDVRGRVTIAGRADNGLDISDVPELNVIKGAVFTDNGAISARINTINIGVGDAIAGAAPGAALDAGDPGEANYVLDAQYAPLDNLAILKGKQINFKHQNAQLTLRNSSNDDRTITLHDNLVGFSAAVVPPITHGGIVLLENKGTGLLTLQSDGGVKNLGTDHATGGHEIDQLLVSGQVTINGNGANALNVSNAKTLNVIKGAVFTDESRTSAQIAAVNIGVGDATAGGADAAAIAAARAPGAATYVLDAKYADFGILNGGKAINFSHAEAQLTLRNSGNDDRTITLHDNLVGFSAAVVPPITHGGIVLLENKGTGLLTLQSDGGVKSLGTAGGGGGHEIDQLRVSGQVTINGNGLNAVNVSNAKTLNVIKGAVFTDESRTSAAIPTINIGVTNPALILADQVPGEATYVLDAIYGDFDILTAGHAINFKHQDAQLTLRNSSANNKTITLHNNLVGFSNTVALPPINNGGIVLLESTGGGILTLQSNGGVETLGTAGGGGGHEIDQLRVSGQVTINGNGANKLNVSNAKTLNVIKGAVFTDESYTSAAIPTINIGVANPDAPLIADRVPGKAAYVLDAKYGGFDILTAGHAINFQDAGAQLTLRNSSAADNREIIFHGNLEGVAGANGGILSLEGTGDHVHTLTLNSAATAVAPITFGATKALTRLDVRGQVTIAGSAANGLDLQHVPELNVIKRAVFTDEGATSAQIAAVNIGVGDATADARVLGARDPGPATYILDAKHGNFNILTAGNAIHFLDAGAQLTLRNSDNAAKTITFYDNLEGVAGNGGILSLEGKGGRLTVDSDGAKTLGAVRELTRLDVRGQVTIAGRDADRFDLQHVPELNVIKGAVFTDEGATSAQIAVVNIGFGDAIAAAAPGAAADAGDPGAANYVLDAKYGDFGILTAGHTINFEHQNAQLTLRNSSANNRTITLHDNLVGFSDAVVAPPINNGGIVLLESTGGGLLTLQSDGAIKTLGTTGGPGHEIDQLRVSGKVTINGNGVNAVNVSNAKTLNVIKGAVFTDESRTSATILTINIGVANPDDPVPGNRTLTGEAAYVLDAKYADFNLIGNNIKFSHADGRLILRNSSNAAAIKTITLANTLAPATNGEGIVELNSVHGGATLQITKAGAQSLGTNLNKLKEVEFSGAGDITITPIIYAYNIKLNGDNTSNVTTNTINGNVEFIKNTKLTIRGANNITGGVTFNAAGRLKGDVGGGVNFAAAGAELEGNVGGAVIFNAAGRLKGDVGGGVNFAAAGAELEGNVGGAVIFNAAGRLKGDVTGDVAFAAAGTVDGNVAGDVGFNADGTVDGNVTGVVTVDGGNSTVRGSIGSVAFVSNGQLTANDGVRGEVDFNNRAGTVTVEHQKTIVGAIKNGKDATLVFAGAGEVKEIKELKLLKVGAGNVKLLAGNYGITEIQGNGTQTLTFADKFNSTGAINTTGGAAVNLIFKGSSIIGGVVGSDKYPVGNIQIKAGTVAFGDSINAKEEIEIAKGATTEISKNFTVKSIKGQGTVRFNNLQELILNTPIEIGTIEIAGDNIQATKKISTGNVLFSNSKEAILTLKEESIISNIETTGNGIHSLALNANLTIKAGNVGSESNRLKEIKLLGNHTISIIGNSLYSNISTANKDSGIVMFNSDDSVAHGNLGTNEFRLSDVTFDSDSTAGGDVYSKKITIKDKKTATFAGTEKRTIDVPGVPRLLKDFAYSTKIGSEEINAEGSSKIQFKSGALVEAPINGGEVILADNVWFKEKVTSAAPVTFAADKYAILEKDVKFASIAANQAKIIMLGEKQTITGDLTAKDLTMDLGTSQVEYGNTAKLTGELKLRSFYDSSKLAGGNIKIQSNGKLDLSQLDKLVVTIAGQTDISEIPDETEYVLISSVDANGISLDPSKVDLEINEQSSFVSWTIDPSNLTLHAKDIHKQVIEKDVIELDKESAKTQDPDAASRLSERAALLKQLNNVTDKDSDAFKYLGEIGLMDKDNRALAMDKLLPGNTNPISMELAFMVNEAISQVASQIASRSVNIMPVASGDDDKVTYGVWGSPFYAVGHQEVRKGISGYRSKSVGGIFGFDGLINDDLLVGVAYSKIDTKMSHKDMKFGDKTNGITNLFSLYGSYKFPSNFFAEAVASYGITDIKNAEGRLVLDDNKKVTTGTAVAKYKSTSYSGQLLTGYNYQPSEKLTITPTIGLRYSQFMDDGHVQSGTAWQNLTVKKTSYNKFEGILGLRTAANIQLDQLLLIPELHGYVNYDFKGKSPKIDARLGGVNEALPTKSVKPAKVSFTVGTGLTVKSNMMEYGVTYNAHIADKYIGHQGSLKVKVNF